METNNMFELQCGDAFFKDNFMYFSARNVNGLFKMNLQTKKTEFVCCFEEEWWRQELHRKVISYKNNLYFIPFCGTGISVYNLIKNEIKIYTLSNDPVTFSDAFIHEGKILLVPFRDMNYFGYFNIDTNQFERLEAISDKLNEIKNKYKNDVFCDLHGALLMRNILYVAIYEKNELLFINLDNDEVIENSIGDFVLDNIEFYDNSLWCCSKHDSSVVRLDKKNNIIKNYKFDLKASDHIFILREIDGCFMAVPGHDKSVYLYNNRDDRWNKIDLVEASQKRNKYNSLIYELRKYDNRIYFYEQKVNNVYCLDIKTKLVTNFQLIIEGDSVVTLKKIRSDMFERKVENGECLLEDDSPDNYLECFINRIVETD